MDIILGVGAVVGPSVIGAEIRMQPAPVGWYVVNIEYILGSLIRAPMKIVQSFINICW